MISMIPKSFQFHLLFVSTITSCLPLSNFFSQTVHTLVSAVSFTILGILQYFESIARCEIWKTMNRSLQQHRNVTGSQIQFLLQSVC
jgi:hypothetical protein